MKIYNSGAIGAGLAIFAILALFPIWRNAMTGASGYSGNTAGLTATGADCIETADWMRKNHMSLLNEWRDLVVRENDRFYEKDGRRIERSLTNTCMSCHLNTPENRTAGSAAHCGVCHHYVGIELYCWECHLDPVSLTKEEK